MTDSPEPGPRGLSTVTAGLRLTAFAFAIVAMAAVVTGYGPEVGTIRSWIEGLEWLAPVAFVLVYAALTVALVPGSVLTLAAGLLFGAGAGSLLTVIGATAGATVAFAIARMGGRSAVETLVSGRAARVDRWLQDRGLTAVVTLRLVPLVPFSAANYAAGISAIPLRDFVLGTAIGIVPGTVAYTVIGARVADPTDPLFIAAIAGLVVLAIAGSLVLRRSGRDEPPSGRTGTPADGDGTRDRASSRA